jgi:hypothetical protein
MNKLLPVLLVEYSDKYPGLQRETVEEHVKSSLKVLNFVFESLEYEGLTGAIPSREIIVYTAYKIDSIDDLLRNHKKA